MVTYTKKNNTYVYSPKEDQKDHLEVEIGDIKQSDFYPQVKIKRWDDEANVSLRLIHNENNPKVTVSGEKIKWDGQKIKAEFYDKPDASDSGGYEFEITLKEKPASNVLEFTLVDKNVEYYYQPPLNQEFKPEDCVSLTETDVVKKTGQKYHRPDNVVGSYEIYAKNVTNYDGGKEYRCGKVGHILRPKIIDSKGLETWGELKIKDGILSVTIPQKFLDDATYPVRHAAGLTLGWDTKGASTVTGLYQYAIGSRYSPASTGTTSSISGYFKNTNAFNINMAIYDHDAANNLPENQLNQTGSTACAASFDNWKTVNMTQAITASTNYWLMLTNNDDNVTCYYTSASCEYRGYSLATVLVFTNPFGNTPGNTDDWVKLSIYATYTVPAASSTSGWRNLMGVGN